MGFFTPHKTNSWAARLLLCLCIIGAPRSGFAHGVDCNQDPLDFEEALSGHWITEDLDSSGESWGRISDCGEGGNYTGGGGDAACLSSQSISASSLDVALQSLDFYLGCLSLAKLKFLLNLQLSGASAALDLEISTDQGSSWQLAQRFDQTAGSFRAASGQVIEVDLTSFSGEGFSPAYVRFRYHDSSISQTDWYVQLDDIELECVDAPRADVSVRLSGTVENQVEGAVQDYMIRVRNFGGSTAQNLEMKAYISGPYEILSLDSSLGSIGLGDDGPVWQLGSVPLDGDYSAYISLALKRKTGTPSDGLGISTVALDAEVHSATCDWRLINNADQLSVSYWHDSDKDGVLDLSDYCPDTYGKSQQGEDCDESLSLTLVREGVSRRVRRVLRVVKRSQSQSLSSRDNRRLLRLRRYLRNLKKNQPADLSALSSEHDLLSLVSFAIRQLKSPSKPYLGLKRALRRLQKAL